VIYPSFCLAHASVNSLFCIAKLTAPHLNGRIIARSIITNIDTKNPPAVAEFVCDKYKALFPRARLGNLKRLFEDTTNLFTGKHPDFMANNLKYHDYEHTLQAKVCLMHLLEGRHLAKTAPRFNPDNSNWPSPAPYCKTAAIRRINLTPKAVARNTRSSTSSAVAPTRPAIYQASLATKAKSLASFTPSVARAPLVKSLRFHFRPKWKESPDSPYRPPTI